MRQLRVMFQGGGARVIILLAAAEALQQIEKENGVEIVEVAGVSAGRAACGQDG
jgi:predicted acylesterase/phospholipase RssA